MTNLFLSEDLIDVPIEGDYSVRIPKEISVETIDQIALISKKMDTGETTAFTLMMETVLIVVKGWNFKNGENVVEFNRENLKKLRFKFLKQIQDKIIEANEDLKELFEQGKEAVDKKKEGTQP